MLLVLENIISDELMTDLWIIATILTIFSIALEILHLLSFSLYGE